MSEIQGRKIFRVFNQEFVVDERYTVTKELGQGAYGIVWYAVAQRIVMQKTLLTPWSLQRGHEQPDG